MSMFGSRNPILNEGAFEAVGPWGKLGAEARSTTMTVQGAATASMILLGIVAATATVVWSFLPTTPMLWPIALIGAIAAFIMAWCVCYKPSWSPALAIPFAVCKGAGVGAISVMWATYAGGSTIHVKGIPVALSGGIVIQAVLLTVAIAAGVLLLNMSGLLRATERYVTIVVSATIGLFLFTLVALVLSFAGIQIPYIWDTGVVGILFSLFVIALASSWLVIDFDFIRGGAENGLPKYMEWYGAIGLMVTLVWLYTSILRLLAMLSRRN